MVDVLDSTILPNDDPNSGINTLIPENPDPSGQNASTNSSGQNDPKDTQGSFGMGSFGPPGKEHFPSLENTPKIEQTASQEGSAPETMSSAEKPSPVPEAPKPKALQEEPKPTKKSPVASRGRVVDKRDTSPVSTIGDFSDPTTAYADKKEADFITGVKKEHGSS